MNNAEGLTNRDRSKSGFFRKLPSFQVSSLINERKNPTLLGHVVLSASLLASFVVADVALSKIGEQKQKKWMSIPDPRAEITLDQNSLYAYDPNKVIEKMLTKIKLTEQEREVLRVYYLHIAARTFVHSDVFSYCSLRSFVTTKIIAAASIITTLCLFFISRVGWERANNSVINIFMIASTIIAFYGTISVSLNYEENAKANRQLFTSYSNLGRETLRFLSTQKSRDGQAMTASDFITYLDIKLEELSEVALEFNTDQIRRSQAEVYQILKPNNQEETAVEK